MNFFIVKSHKNTQIILEEHPMKCFIKGLFGLDANMNESNELCTPLPPIVKSLVGSIIFVTLFTIVSHIIRV